MLVLGILLLLLAAALFIGFLASGTQQVTFDGGVLDVTMSTLTIYLLGALTLLLLVGGLALMRIGLRQANRRRREKKELSRLSAKEAERREEPGGATATDPKATDSTTTDTGPTRGTTAATPTSTSSTTTTSPSDGGDEHGTARA